MPTITREEWGARPYRGTPVPLGRPERVVIHHAAGHRAETYAAGVEAVQRIQAYHQDARGWSDIGYHYLVSQAGDVFEGRGSLPSGELIRGAHVAGLNRGSVGVCLLGNFESECAGLRQLDAVAALVAELARAYAIAPERVQGHRDLGETLCPGRNVYTQFDALRDRVRTLT